MLLQLRVSLETDALQKHIQASLYPILYHKRQYDIVVLQIIYEVPGNCGF